MKRVCLLKPNEDVYSETFIANQIKYLKPYIVLYDGWYPSIKQNGKSFLSFPFNIKFVRGSLRNLFSKIYHKIFSFYFSGFLINNKIEVVLANYGPMGTSVMEVCRKLDIPLVVHFHGFDAAHIETINKYKERYYLLFQSCKKVIVVSEDMKKAINSLGAPMNKISLIPYGVQIDEFYGGKPEVASEVFIYVGRFTAKKSPKNLILAFNEVLKEIPHAKLITIGDGELLEDAKMQVKNLGIENNVVFHGKQDKTFILNSLQKARCFVQHSMIASNGDSEGTPNTILEASATGLPIVSTKHAGIKEAVIHGETGFLVNEGDWKSMAEYMIKLGKDPLLACEMGKAARNYMKLNYAIDKQAQLLIEELK